MNREPEVSRRTLRLPPDVASYLEQEAKARFTSQNAEAVRLMREGMVREAAGQGSKADSPAASSNLTACQGSE